MQQTASSKIGRNEPCPCGSGKKYKSCCNGSALKGDRTIPPDAQVMQQHAQRAVAQGDFAGAEQWFRKLHAIRPNDALVLASLGQALCWLNRKREGLSYLLRAAKLLENQAKKNVDPRPIIELSSQLLHWGEVNAAERLAKLAVTLTANSPFALNNLALCLSRVNRNSEALPIARQVCQLLPNHPGCNILLAIIESQLGDSSAALERLESVIRRNDDPEQTARAHLEMGVILDKLGRYDEAFPALTKAAESRSALLKQRPETREYLFEVLQTNSLGFDCELLHRWPAEALKEDELPTPAFLLGFLRSGTTLTEQILDAHPRVIATDESSIVHELTQELQSISGITNDHARALKSLNDSQIKQLRQFYWQRMRQEYGEDVMHKQLVDKNALNTIDVGVISVIFPEAKILFALRDPRDVCISCFMQAFSPAPATVNLLSWQGIAKQYAAVMHYWLKVRYDIQPKFLELRYEDTVADFEQTYRKVFAFLGVEWWPDVIKYHEQTKGRYISTPSFSAVSQPVYRTAVARWKHYEARFASILPILAPFIDVFGYADRPIEQPIQSNSFLLTHSE